MTKQLPRGHRESGNAKAPIGARRVRRAVEGLQALQKQICKRSGTGLSDRETRSAIEAGRR